MNTTTRYAQVRQSLLKADVSLSALHVAYTNVTGRDTRTMLRGVIVAVQAMDRVGPSRV